MVRNNILTGMSPVGSSPTTLPRGSHILPMNGGSLRTTHSTVISCMAKGERFQTNRFGFRIKNIMDQWELEDLSKFSN